MYIMYIFLLLVILVNFIRIVTMYCTVNEGLGLPLAMWYFRSFSPPYHSSDINLFQFFLPFPFLIDFICSLTRRNFPSRSTLWRGRFSLTWYTTYDLVLRHLQGSTSIQNRWPLDAVCPGDALVDLDPTGRTERRIGDPIAARPQATTLPFSPLVLLMVEGFENPGRFSCLNGVARMYISALPLYICFLCFDFFFSFLFFFFPSLLCSRSSLISYWSVLVTHPGARLSAGMEPVGH